MLPTKNFSGQTGHGFIISVDQIVYKTHYEHSVAIHDRPLVNLIPRINRLTGQLEK